MRLLLGLLLCLRCCSPAPAKWRTGAPPLSSLRVSITLTPIPGAWQLFCAAKVEVHGEPCFSYDCQSKELTPICVRGKKVEAPLREDLREILKDLTEKFKEKLLDVDPGDSQRSNESEATLVIQEEASGHSRGSWQLMCSGRIFLCLDLVTRAWTAAHPGDRWMLAKWEEDTDMNVFLWKTSYRQWKMWLQEVAAHWGMPGTTAPTSTTPGTSGGKSTMQDLWVISGITLAYVILSVIIIYSIT